MMEAVTPSLPSPRTTCSETSPTPFGFFWELVSGNTDLVSFAGFERAVLTDSPQVFGGEHVFESLEAQADQARVFTRGMHGTGMGPAFAWPERSTSPATISYSMSEGAREHTR